MVKVINACAIYLTKSPFVVPESITLMLHAGVKNNSI